MKSLKFILITIALAISINTISAQDELYRKYSGKEGVTKVYISETMFSLFKGTDLINISSGATDAVNIGGIIESLTGLYILSCDNLPVSKEMEEDFDLLLQEYKLELLMEIEDNSDIIRMYISREGKIIKNFFMKVTEQDGSLTIMFFKGNISESELSKIVVSAQ